MDKENDNMETIIYQGQEVAVEPMGEMGGYMGKLRGQGRSGGDELFRDEAGRYYLRQKRFVESDKIQWMCEAEEAGVLFERVHAININAAILWAISFTGSDGWKLRCDAAELLMEGRGYSDPRPTHLSAEQRAVVSNPDRFAKQRETEAGSGRITVELDDLASAMLRKVCRKGNACHEAGDDPRDLVNAAVTFYLCGEDNDQHGEFDLNDSSDALKRAKHDRLALATNARQADTDEPTPATVPASPREASVTTPFRVEPGVHRFTFDYPATEKVCGRRRVVELSDEQMERARELAAHFDLSAEAFLGGLADNNDLPGQPRRSGNKLGDVIRASDIAFVCTDEAITKRIERAAQACERTVDAFVADALGRDVDMYEENMLVHPTTGAMLEGDFEVLYEEGKLQITAGPIGRENDPQFMGHPGKQYVSFGVYLSPEELERLEYPHMVTDCTADRELPFVLIPVDPEGNPHLSIGGKYVRAEELSSSREQAEEAA